MTSPEVSTRPKTEKEDKDSSSDELRTKVQKILSKSPRLR